MLDVVRQVEVVREALVSMYDPVALRKSALHGALTTRGNRLDGPDLVDFLVTAIESLRPTASAPLHTHGLRRYRYLWLRYVECRSHAAIAEDLGMSLRHASRIHQEALEELSASVFAMATIRADSASAESTLPPARRRFADLRSAMSSGEYSAELADIAALPTESGVSVVELVRGIEAVARRFVESHGAQLTLDLDPDLPLVRVNRVVLRQILLNLLVVVVEGLTGAGSERVIRLTSERLAASVDLHIQVPRSTIGLAGPGVAIDGSLPQYRSAETLAHGQGVRISTDQGRLNVAISLPRGDPCRVLLVDDNPDVGDLFGRMLERTAYELVHVRTARRALAQVRDISPHIILLDIVMPGHDGWEILNLLKSDSHTERIPIVVCSVLPDRELALTLGADDFLAKPVTRGALRALLNRLVRQE